MKDSGGARKLSVGWPGWICDDFRRHISHKILYCYLSSLNYTPVQYLNLGRGGKDQMISLTFFLICADKVTKKHNTNVAPLIDSCTVYYYCAEFSLW